MKNKRLLLLFGILLFFFILCNSAEEDKRILEQRILDRLLDPRVYDKRVRPDGDSGRDSPVTVKVSLYIMDIMEKDPYLKEFYVLGYFRQSWQDNRLVFKEFGKRVRREIRLNEPKIIWKPDIYIINEIDVGAHNTVSPERMFRISDAGRVFAIERLSATLKCNSKLEYFPFDQQKCSIDIESFGSRASELLLDWDSMPYSSTIRKNISSAYFLLQDFKSIGRKADQKNFTAYQTLRFDLLFQRRVIPFFWSLYVPHIMLIILSWASFLLDSKKFFLRLAFIGAIYFLMAYLTPNFQQLRNYYSGITALDIWTSFCFTLIGATFVEFIIVSSIAQTEKKKKSKNHCNELENDDVAHPIEDGPQTSRLKRINCSRFHFLKSYGSLSKRIDTVSLWCFISVFILFVLIYFCVFVNRECSNLQEWYGRHT